MRAAYLWLARLISLLIVVQAMTITFAVAGLFHWITDGGGVVDDSVVKGWDQNPPTFEGAIGHYIHLMAGERVIPPLALLLLLVSFFAKVSKGVVIALVLLLLVVLQTMSGLYADGMPYLGLFHGLNAFLIFGAAMAAAMMAKKPAVAAAA
ncbi:MAG TPA: hypothetical protein VMZ66_00845 [Aeromicrobium sp.]|nr:hypothetical protein [Aeromicrobium sp.]